LSISISELHFDVRGAEATCESHFAAAAKQTMLIQRARNIMMSKQMSMSRITVRRYDLKQPPFWCRLDGNVDLCLDAIDDGSVLKDNKRENLEHQGEPVHHDNWLSENST
jgi:hypothetical protein